MTAPATTPQQVVIPNDLGSLNITPPNWQWQGDQQELANRIANSTKKIIMLEAECGTGKSVIPIAAAAAAGKEAVILIRTIQLQEQYLRDINGLVMLTGRSRYQCEITGNSAEWAPCTIGMRCSLKGQWRRGKPLTTPECSYYRHKAVAANSQFKVLNYSYWLREIRGVQSTFDRVDWIVCDEAHEIEQVLMDAGIIIMRRSSVKNYIAEVPDDKTVEGWMEWANKHASAVGKLLATVTAQAKEAGLIEDPESPPLYVLDPNSAEAKAIIERFRELKALSENLSEILAITDPEKWVYDGSDNRAYLIEPCYGAPAFKKLLACANDKVILMSAFLAPAALIKNLELDPDDVDVILAPEVFDRSRSQIFYCPTVKMGFQTQPHEWGYVCGVIDMIAATPAFANAKGIIHVPSVQLRDKIMRGVNPSTRARLLAYDAADTDIGYRRYGTKDQALKRFTDSPEPLILLGQSVSTGIDLPHVPQWQIITKLSFPPFTTPALAKRNATDKMFMKYLTLCELVQAAGRIKRATDHDGPTFILDEQFGWFEPSMRAHMPQWFRRALIKKGWDRWIFYKNQLRKIAFRNGVII